MVECLVQTLLEELKQYLSLVSKLKFSQLNNSKLIHMGVLDSKYFKII